MRAAAALLAVPLLLVACSAGEDAAAPDNVAAALEAVARERGVVRDPTRAITGAYTRGADRLCLLGTGEEQRIGLVVAYDQANGCRARGTARQEGERVRIDLGRGCAVTARFDGERLALPGSVPDACAAVCRGSASLAGLTVERVSDAPAEAAALRDEEGRALCTAA